MSNTVINCADEKILADMKRGDDVQLYLTMQDGEPFEVHSQFGNIRFRVANYQKSTFRNKPGALLNIVFYDAAYRGWWGVNYDNDPEILHCVACLAP